MLDFQYLTLADKTEYEKALLAGPSRGCEYSFANLYLWGRQKMTRLGDFFLLFSQFNRRTVYPFPVGSGDLRPALDAIIADAEQRGIPCRITGLSEVDMQLIEQLYPGKFRFHCDRDSYDYIYDIRELATLPGRKFQKKRNHLNRFRTAHPSCTVQPIAELDIPAVESFAKQWYAAREAEDPQGDLYMEKAALRGALAHYKELGLEGLMLLEEGRILAFTMGSFLSADTVDVHFEKADPLADGAYPAINQAFAQYLQEKYPHILYLNREDDMGLEGLRKAKLSYNPHRLAEKCWACLLEEGHDY